MNERNFFFSRCIYSRKHRTSRFSEILIAKLAIREFVGQEAIEKEFHAVKEKFVRRFLTEQ